MVIPDEVLRSALVLRLQFSCNLGEYGKSAASI